MRRALAVTFAIGLCLAPASAQAYDTALSSASPDALTAEGFGVERERRHGQQLVRGLLHEPGRQPVLRHANALVGFLRFKLNHENWLHQWVEGARRLHFYAGRRQPEAPNLSNTAGVDHEWRRLMFLTRKWVQRAGRENDPLEVMAVLGMLLHAVQDFYAHSNWVEDPDPEEGAAVRHRLARLR